MAIGTLLLAGAAIALAGTIGIIGYGISVYNSLVFLKQSINTQWSNIKTEYQRRLDLILSIAKSVKGYAKFEKTTLTAVTAMRSALGKVKDGGKKDIAKLSKIDNVMSKINIAFEAYPELRAVEQYNKLTQEIRVAEDRVNVARTSYNRILRDYNVLCLSFPSNLFAKMLGWKERNDFFDVLNEEAQYRPDFDVEIKD